MSSVLITGAGGQDGYYLATLLSDKGYEVHGLDKQGQSHRMEAIPSKNRWDVSLFQADALKKLLQQIQPVEIYHLAAFSFVNSAPEEEPQVLKNNIDATHNLLIACASVLPESRICLASSAEIFGRPDHSPQSESSPVQPANIYGVSKATCHHLAGAYRHRGYFASSAILFNHESPRRGEKFVTQKIVRTAVAIKKGQADRLVLGDVDTVRDWGFAGDYVRAMSMMLQAREPADYVIASGHGHTVRDFANMVFQRLGLNLEDWLQFDPSLSRPVERFPRVGDSSLIRQQLGWAPEHSFADLVDLMVDAELNRNTNS